MNPPSPFSDLSVVLRNLRDALGLWCTRGLLGHALGLVVWARLSGVALRMARLADRYAAGRLPAGRPPAGHPAAGVRPASDGSAGPGCGVGAPQDGVARLWPGGFAWLVRLAGWQAAGFGSQLRTILQTPEMVALLEASPQAGRMLRPICRMLAVETALLRLPVRVKPKAESVATAGAVPAMGRLKRVTAVVEPWRIPLPRGVLAAARRQGYGRIRFAKDQSG